MKKYWIEILLIIMTLMVIGVTIANSAEPTCSVKAVNGKYVGKIVSPVLRVPEAVFTVDVPAQLPVEKDSYYNTCFTFEDHKPVQNTKVVVYVKDDWSVEANTTFTGCVDMKIPSDVNFTIKAYNPLIKGFSELNGRLTSAGKGKLFDDRQKVMWNRPWKVTTEKGVLSFKEYSNGFIYKVNLKETKHSVVVHIPTVVGKEYIVKFKSNRPVWVWFSDNARGKNNPAKLNGGGNKFITLTPNFKATKTETRLYFQPQTDHTTKISELSIVKK